jgi:hypothetical protein
VTARPHFVAEREVAKPTPTVRQQPKVQPTVTAEPADDFEMKVHGIPPTPVVDPSAFLPSSRIMQASY